MLTWFEINRRFSILVYLWETILYTKSDQFSPFFCLSNKSITIFVIFAAFLEVVWQTIKVSVVNPFSGEHIFVICVELCNYHIFGMLISNFYFEHRLIHIELLFLQANQLLGFAQGKASWDRIRIVAGVLLLSTEGSWLNWRPLLIILVFLFFTADFPASLYYLQSKQDIYFYDFVLGCLLMWWLDFTIVLRMVPLFPSCMLMLVHFVEHCSQANRVHGSSQGEEGYLMIRLGITGLDMWWFRQAHIVLRHWEEDQVEGCMCGISSHSCQL